MKTWEIGEGGASLEQREEIMHEFLDIRASRRLHACLEFISDDGVSTHIMRETRTKKWLFFTISNDSVYRKGIKSVLKKSGTVKVGATLPRRRW